MDCFKRVESLMKYRIIKIFDIIIAVLVLYAFQNYVRRIMNGLLSFGVIDILLISALIYVEYYFLKRIKMWCIDQYISVPGLVGVFSKKDIKGLMIAEDFVCPKSFKGTYFEKKHKLYESKEWLCVCGCFFHKKMIAMLNGRHFRGHNTLGRYFISVILYTGESVEIECEDNAYIKEKWEEFLQYITEEAGGFLLNEYIHDEKKLKKMLKDEIRQQQNPKEWLLSGAAIEYYKSKLAGNIKAKEDFIESTGNRRNDAIAERRRKQIEEEAGRKAKERQKMREKRNCR